MNLNPITMLGAGVLGGAVAGSIAAAGFVSLQDVTPGATQAGHTNITGYSLAGRFGSGVSPTLARMQVKETGGLQGVRSESGTGVAVFGKSTAATGLGAGGYFTTSSVGGRGIVGDALSGTGNTVGGLFYNRSTGGGVAVWGRAIGNGTATGVFGEVLSAGATALKASNAASGDRMEAAGPGGSLLTHGTLPQHEYATSVNRGMVPVAYGAVSPTGIINTPGSGNWTVVKIGTGDYRITINGVNWSFSNDTAVVSATYNGYGSTYSISNTLGVNTYEGGALTDKYFTFVAFKSVPGAAYPPTPNHGFKDDIEWSIKRPREFARYQAACRAEEARVMEATKASPNPVDEFEPNRP